WRALLPRRRHRHHHIGVQGHRSRAKDRVSGQELPHHDRALLLDGRARPARASVGGDLRPTVLAKGGRRMTFAWPHMFWLLLVPVALLVAELARRRRAAANDHPKILHAEAGSHRLSLVNTPARRHRARAWLCVGLVLCVIALARPQWGRIDEPVFDQAREIIIAIDLSRSMLTPDVKPSRLD